VVVVVDVVVMVLTWGAHNLEVIPVAASSAMNT